MIEVIRERALERIAQGKHMDAILCLLEEVATGETSARIRTALRSGEAGKALASPANGDTDKLTQWINVFTQENQP